MQRINKKTNLPFQQGDKKPGGWVFECYLSTLDKRGYFKELWLKPPKPTPLDHNHKRNTLLGRLKSLLSNAKAHSKPRGHDWFELTIDDLFELWCEQGGLCAYSGLQLSTQTGSPYVVSLERKDNDIGYTKDNISLICWAVNDAKGKLSYDFFVNMCVSIANNLSK